MKWRVGTIKNSRVVRLLLAVSLLTAALPASGAQARATISLDQPQLRSLLRVFPVDAEGVLFADVAQLRDLDFVQGLVREQADAQIPGPLEEFLERTGVDPEDIFDQVMIGRSGPDQVLVAGLLAMDSALVEQYFSGQGIESSTYAQHQVFAPESENDWSVVFDDRLVILGSTPMVHAALDRMDGGATALDNADLVAAIQAIDAGNQVWAVGNFSESMLPEGVGLPMASDLIESLEKISYQMNVSEGVSARLAGEFATIEAANRARDLLRGVVAFGKMGSTQQPDMIELLDGIQITDADTSVNIQFKATDALLTRIANSGLLSLPSD